MTKKARPGHAGNQLRKGTAALSVGAAVMWAIYGTPTSAASNEAGPASDSRKDELAEVVVTARRRAENLQDVPIAITAFSPETLAENHVGDMNDLQMFTPSLSFETNPDRYTSNVTIRGQGPSTGSTPAVIFYLDEVPLASNTTQGVAQSVGGPGFFFDLDSIQVLKGPQGTLFGRNTDGGAILVQSARPKDDVEGNVSGTYGNYDDREIEAVLNAPIISHTLLARLAVTYQDRDGFTQQQGEPGRPFDSINSKGVRLTLTFKPSDDIQNDLIYRFADLSSSGTSLLLSAVDPAVATSAGFPSLVQLLAEQQALGTRTALATSQFDYMERKFWGLTDIFRADLAPNVTFRNIAAYNGFHYSSGVDWDATVLPIFDVLEGGAAPVHVNQYTEEPQIQGTALRGNLTYTAGAFYLDAPAGGFAQSETTIFGNTDRLLARGAIRSEALYSQGTYDLSSLAEGLKVTGGYRYTWDHAFLQQITYDVNYKCLTGPVATCEGQGAGNFSSPNWNFDLDYDIVHGTMLYLAVKRGYRSGGFYSSATGTYGAYDPEHLTDYETGVKSEWSLAGMRARTNFDVYVDNYQSIQVPFASEVGGTLLYGIKNAANARIEGAEFEGSFFPTSLWEFGTTFSYVNFAYTEVFPGGQVNASHYFPKWKYSANTRYHLPLASTLGDASFGANWAWQGNSFIAAAGDPFALERPYGVLNVSAGWDRINGGPCDVSFFMTNALNKVYAVGSGITGAYQAWGESTLIYGIPRMYGIRLNYRFGAAR